QRQGRPRARARREDAQLHLRCDAVRRRRRTGHLAGQLQQSALLSLPMSIALPPISMTGTLFGGLLLAALLFFAGRRLGLSGFWAGVLSGALPFLAYLVYSSQHWGGGDVL